MSLFDDFEDNDNVVAATSDYDDEPVKESKPEKVTSKTKEPKHKENKAHIASNHKHKEPEKKESKHKKKEPVIEEDNAEEEDSDATQDKSNQQDEEQEEPQQNEEDITNDQNGTAQSDEEDNANDPSVSQTDDYDNVTQSNGNDQNEEEGEEDITEKHYKHIDGAKKDIKDIKKAGKQKSKPVQDSSKNQGWIELVPLYQFSDLPSVNVPTDEGPVSLRYFTHGGENYYLMKDVYEKSKLESSKSIVQKKAKAGVLDQFKISDGKDMLWVSSPKKIAAVIAASPKMATRTGLLKYFAEKHPECKEYYDPNQKKKEKRKPTETPSQSHDVKDGVTTESPAPKKKRSEKAPTVVTLSNEQFEAIKYALDQLEPIQKETSNLAAIYQSGLKNTVEIGQKISAMKIILESTLQKNGK
jgi:hypothetical protein